MNRLLIGLLLFIVIVIIVIVMEDRKLGASTSKSLVNFKSPDIQAQWTWIINYRNDDIQMGA